MKELGQDECIVFGDWTYGAMSCVPFTGGEGTNQVCAKVVPGRDGRGEHEGGEEVMPFGPLRGGGRCLDPWPCLHSSQFPGGPSATSSHLQDQELCRSSSPPILT